MVTASPILEMIPKSSPRRVDNFKKRSKKSKLNKKLTRKRLQSPPQTCHNETNTQRQWYSQILLTFWIKVIRFSLSFKFINHLSLKSNWAAAALARTSKGLLLLRLPSIVYPKSFDYYALRIVASRTATFLLKIKKFRPGRYYRWSQSERSYSTASPSGQHPNLQNNVYNGGRSSYSRLRSLPLYNYFRSLKWFPIPLSLGFALLAYQHYRRVLRRNRIGQATTEEEAVQQDWEITCYRTIPWKTISRAWGWVNSITLPEWSRSTVLGWYATTYNCNLEEAECKDLKLYKNLGEFFRRSLKDGVRPVDPKSAMVSPSDGKIFHMGKVDCGVIEQVKGVRYSLQSFLGPPSWTNTNCDKTTNLSKEDYSSTLLKSDNKNNSLFYCVIYLAPGDYHRFHSPTDWQIDFRRHFAGELLSVNPAVANWIGGLFSLNERAVYIGNWKHGFFSMAAVGATNVGSIQIYQDPKLQTNIRGLKKNTYQDLKFDKPLTLKKGECFGEFNFGSTIILIFEAPSDFQFSSQQKDTTVRVGEALISTECS